jgi:hypothetical protein
VCVDEQWQGNDFNMCVEGRVKEARLHGENLTLKRRVTTQMGQNKLNILDFVENESVAETPLMLLYHINIGYPLLDEGSRFICKSKRIRPIDEMVQVDASQYNTMSAPFFGARENVYLHDLYGTSDGTTYTGIINDRLEMGAYVRFNNQQLPKFTEWKMMNESEYVLGIEPGNCHPIGRSGQRECGDLELLKPGQRKKIELEIGILTDQEQIQQFEKMVLELDR